MEVKCPKCTKIQHGDYCSSCHTNLKSLQLAVAKSQIYYIEAYQLAEKRNFKVAKDLLQKSILFDKYNIEAKNLLGLIHFEMGEVGEALKLWIFSTSLCRENNIGNEYIEKLRKKPRKFEQYKEAIRLYNHGLEYLVSKNEDVAIIRLKKAIALNPKFIEAKNLLAASYIAIGQYDKAHEQIQQVLHMDIGNEKALHYLSELGKGEFTEADIEKSIESPNINQKQYYHGAKPQHVINRGGTLGKYILYFLFGALCMYGVEVALVIPSETSNLEQKIYELTHENSDMKIQIETFTQSYKEEILELEKTKQELTDEVATLSHQALTSEQEKKLAQAELYVQRNDWVNAAGTLNNVLESSLDEEQLSRYNQLKDESYLKAAEVWYVQGYNDLKQEEYDQANSAFDKVIIYAPDTVQGANALYYKGEIAEKTNDQAKAIEYYQSVVRGHEGKDAAYKAKKKLEQLNP